jgi:undecaprenyl phosphate-alpha-L-ara4N flippase subunit ArnF
MKEMSSRTATGLVLLSVILTSCAQLLFRISMQGLPLLESLASGDVASAFSLVTSSGLVMLAFGIALYAASMLSWIFALSRFEVSLAYPLLSISYVLVYVGAIALPGLDETASLLKMIGIAVIAIGVAVISLGERRSST